jgi:hypothetical protein
LFIVSFSSQPDPTAAPSTMLTPVDDASSVKSMRLRDFGHYTANVEHVQGEALAAKMDSTEITLYSLCVKFLQYLLELEGWAKKHGRLATARIVLTAEPPQSVLDNLLNGFRGCLVQMHSIASSQ